MFAGKGSVQQISEIPDSIKEIYKTSWEISQKTLIKMAAERGWFVCQSQSLNLFMEDVNAAKLTGAHFYAWKEGLKTGMYYLRTKSASDASQGLGIDLQKIKELDQQKEAALEAVMQDAACSLDNPDACESCSG